jgi:Ala-tRNA(Pro) deacylase
VIPGLRLKQLLEVNSVPYSSLTHAPVYTAQHLAAAENVTGSEVAKTVVIRADAGYALVVLPASMKIDFSALRDQLPFHRIALARESEFARFFPDCELGAMPPFGNLYHLPVYIDRSLAAADAIVFNAGCHVEAVRLRYADFDGLVRPTPVNAAVPLSRARSDTDVMEPPQPCCVDEALSGAKRARGARAYPAPIHRRAHCIRSSNEVPATAEPRSVKRSGRYPERRRPEKVGPVLGPPRPDATFLKVRSHVGVARADRTPSRRAERGRPAKPR